MDKPEMEPHGPQLAFPDTQQRLDKARVLTHNPQSDNERGLSRQPIFLVGKVMVILLLGRRF
jgi:hypothetical protein